MNNELRWIHLVIIWLVWSPNLSKQSIETSIDDFSSSSGEILDLHISPSPQLYDASYLRSVLVDNDFSPIKTKRLFPGCEDTLVKVTNSLTKLQNEKMRLMESVKELKAVGKELCAQQEFLQQNITELKNDNEFCENRIQESNLIIYELNNTVKDLKYQLQTITSERKTWDKNLRTFQIESENLKQKIEKLNEMNEVVTFKNSLMQNVIEELNSQILFCKSQLNDTIIKVNNLSIENEGLEKNIMLLINVSRTEEKQEYHSSREDKNIKQVGNKILATDVNVRNKTRKSYNKELRKLRVARQNNESYRLRNKKLEIANNELLQKLRDKDIEIETLNRKISDLILRNEKLTKNKRVLKRKNSDLVAKTDTLYKHIDSYRGYIEMMRQQQNNAENSTAQHNDTKIDESDIETNTVPQKSSLSTAEDQMTAIVNVTMTNTTTLSDCNQTNSPGSKFLADRMTSANVRKMNVTINGTGESDYVTAGSSVPWMEANLWLILIILITTVLLLLVSCCVAIWCCCCSRGTEESNSHYNVEMHSVPQLLDNPHSLYAALEHHLMERQQRMLDTICRVPSDQIHQTSPTIVRSNIQRPKCLMDIDYY